MRHSARPRTAPRSRRAIALAAAVGAFLLVVTFAVAPPPQTDAYAAGQDAGAVSAGAKLAHQSLDVSDDVAALGVTRDGYSATSGEESLIAGGTNHDWAKLVMMFGGWPVSDSNVAVFTRWMRQENGPDDWWNRNNPLNNGYGSGGGAGLGSYPDLVVAAQNAAENLQNHSGYAAIRAGFAASAPTAQIEQAIWASPWATSHYGNGTHWSTTPVPVIKAPADAWG